MKFATYITDDELVEGLTDTIALLNLHELSGSMSTVALAQAIKASTPSSSVTTHDLLNALVPD
jgi:hypothetical protein